jgi:hypothetical protein
VINHVRRNEHHFSLVIIVNHYNILFIFINTINDYNYLGTDFLNIETLLNERASSTFDHYCRSLFEHFDLHLICTRIITCLYEVTNLHFDTAIMMHGVLSDEDFCNPLRSILQVPVVGQCRFELALSIGEVSFYQAHWLDQGKLLRLGK